MSALRDTFRAMRESKGLTLADVSERIHIRMIYLAAIEAEDWASIGPPVYVRGFVRSYARFLGLDAEAAVAQINADPSIGVPAPAAVSAPPVRSKPAARADSVSPDAVFYPEPDIADPGAASKPRLSIGAIAGIVVALLLVSFVGYEYFAESQHGEPAGLGAAATVEPVARAAPSDAAWPPDSAPAEIGTVDKNSDGSNAFALSLNDSSWLQVVVDGKVAMEGVYPKGTRRRFAGRSVTVRVGNAGGVDISVGGKDLGPMGGVGDVAERSYQL
jgi:hypothetical protein